MAGVWSSPLGMSSLKKEEKTERDTVTVTR
jgi:hypothetical protein